MKETEELAERRTRGVSGKSRRQRQVEVELFRRSEGGQLVADGRIVAVYVDGRRGGTVRAPRR